MYKYIVLDINIFAIVILSFLIFNYKHSFKFGSLSEKFFAVIIISNISLLFSDLVATSLSGISGFWIIMGVYFFTAVFFSSCLVLCISWLYFYITRVNRMDKLDSILLKFILPIPFVAFNLFMLLTLKQNYIFGFSSANKYFRGDFFHLTTICGFLYIISALFYILAKKKSLAKGEFFPFVILPLVAIILGLMQSFIHFPTLFVWPALAIVCNGIHINVLDTKVSTDHLTGLNNRFELDSYLKKISKEHRQKNQSLGILMIDVDSFKSINDNFGHVEGDEALKNCSIILKECLYGSSFIARYGGDEFCVVISECNEKKLKEVRDAIINRSNLFNNNSKKPYTIQFSIGQGIFSGNDLLNVDKIINYTDASMYENKHVTKQKMI